jgi:hypothetical protein
MYHGDGTRPNTLTWFITLNRAAMDGDQAEADHVRDAFVAALKSRGHDPDTDLIFIPTQAAADIVNVDNREALPTQRVTAYLKTLNIATLRYCSRSDMGGRGWLWRGPDCKAEDRDKPAPLGARDAEQFVHDLKARRNGNGTGTGPARQGGR